MKQNVILKSIIRKPIIAILLTLLIGLISYGFVGKAVETIIVDRETKRLESYYRSIGYVDMLMFSNNYKGEQKSFEEAAEIIKESPAIAFDDLERGYMGIMHDYYYVDNDFPVMDVAETPYIEESYFVGSGVHNMEYWFYGKLLEYQKKYGADKKGNEFFGGYQFIFEVEEVLAGDPDRIEAGKNYVMWIPARLTVEIEKMIPHLEKMKEGQSYLIRAWHHPMYSYTVSGTNIGVENRMNNFNLKAIDGDDLWYIPVEDGERLDLNLPEYRNEKFEIDRLNANLRAIQLISTTDMSALPETQPEAKSHYLVEGRWINHFDELEANKVIVIPINLAEKRGIKLGDEIAFTIQGLKDPYDVYIRDSELENWQDDPSQEISYEVVGMYSTTRMDIYGPETIRLANSYVPASTIDCFDNCALPFFNGEKEFKTRSYSFILTNPREQVAFIESYSAKLKEIGFDLKFVDNNGMNFMAGADPMRRSNLIGMLLFMAALLLAIALSVFLYLRQQQKNFAILRALGVPAKKANQDLILPLLGLGFVGASLGSLLSWQNALAKASDSLSQLPLPSGVFPDPTLDVKYGLLLWFLLMLVLLVAVYFGNRRVTRVPVLELLQDNKTKAVVRDTNPIADMDDVQSKLAETMRNQAEMGNLRGKADPKLAIRAFSKSNILRSPTRSLLTIIVAAGLLLALGWLQTLIRDNEKEVSRLYAASPIQIDFPPSLSQGFMFYELNSIKREAVDWMLDSGFIEQDYRAFGVKIDSIWEDGKIRDIPPYGILAINDLDLALEGLLSGQSITFLENYGPETFSEIWTPEMLKETSLPIVIPEATMKDNGWTLGDELVLGISGHKDPVSFKVVGVSQGGSVSFSKSTYKGITFKPFIANLSSLELGYSSFMPNFYEARMFTKPEMNYRLEELKSEMTKVEPNPFPSKVQIWDEELMAVVEPMEQNLSLMERLYPVTMVISAVIGGVLSLLLVLNQAKETALLRMLGVEKGKIRAMQVKQILFLTLIGLLLGFILLISLRGLGAAQPSVAVAALVYLVGALLGALLGDIQVSNKKPMELLQVKE